MTATIEARRPLLAALWAEAWRIALLAAIIAVAVLVVAEAVVAETFPFLADRRIRPPATCARRAVHD
jgi:hypothetical protein